MCKVDYIRQNCNGLTKIRDFYMWAFPTDELGKDINGGVDFNDAFECLQVGYDFYSFLGVSDSIVRERVFDALATLMGCSYDHIYYQWLNQGKRPLRGARIEDMTGMRFRTSESIRQRFNQED
jgi:hypothetical protein